MYPLHKVMTYTGDIAPEQGPSQTGGNEQLLDQLYDGSMYIAVVTVWV